MRIFLFLAIILALGTISSSGQTTTSESSSWVPAEKFDETRDAAMDIKLGIAEAMRSGRRVLLDVGGEWCIWCHRLDTLFMKNPDLNDFLHENFVVVKVNYSKGNKNTAVLSKYPDVAGYPHIFILDSGGKLLHSQNTGDLEEGKGHSREKVFAFLKEWAPSIK